MAQLVGNVFETSQKTQTDFNSAEGRFYVTYRERLHFLEENRVELFRIMIEDQWRASYPLERHRFYGTYEVLKANPLYLQLQLHHHFLKVKLSMQCLPLAGQALICHGQLTNSRGEQISFDEYFEKK